MVRSSKNDLYAINTIFGWVVGGCCESNTEAASTHVCCYASTSSSAETDRLLKSFWESEEPPTANTLTEDDDRALTYFNTTHSRLEDGRYEVRTPRRLTVKPLGNSRSQAVRRYNTNKRSLQRKGKWKDFAKAVKEYAKLGHSELVPPSDLNKPVTDIFYMPMHGVVKESSTTTKLRIVFDASPVTSTGISLNDSLIPDL